MNTAPSQQLHTQYRLYLRDAAGAVVFEPVLCRLDIEAANDAAALLCAALWLAEHQKHYPGVAVSIGIWSGARMIEDIIDGAVGWPWPLLARSGAAV